VIRRSSRPALHEGLAIVIDGEIGGVSDGAMTSGSIRLRGRIDVIAVGAYLWITLDHLVVGGPTLEKHQLVTMSFARSGDAGYQSSVRVIELDERLARLCVTFPGELHRNQARAHMRIVAPLLASVAPAGPKRMGSTEGWTEIRTHDVSAGGVSFDLDRPLKVNECLLATVVVPTRSGDVELEARAEIVRTELVQPSVYRHAARFLDLTRTTEDELIGALLWLETHRPAS
jgi:c-di-GMP-binding flagellar brake protein YcgR